MTLCAAIDYSWAEAAFAVTEKGAGCIFERSLPLSGRSASELPVWMNYCLREHKIELQSIEEWTVGTGPGGFTGLRLVAALVAGICFGRPGVRTRGMSSAVAMLMALPEAASCSNPVALFDGRRGETLAFGLRREGAKLLPSGFKAVLADAKQAGEALSKHDLIFALRKDMPALEASLGESLASRVRPVERLKVSALALNAPGDFDSSLSDLIYLRPPVFVEPKEPRSV